MSNVELEMVMSIFKSSLNESRNEDNLSKISNAMSAVNFNLAQAGKSKRTREFYIGVAMLTATLISQTDSKETLVKTYEECLLNPELEEQGFAPKKC